MWSNQMRILLLLGIVLVVGCSLEDHASYEPANNDLATGGPLLVVEQGAPVNLDEVTESLGQEDLATFQESLSWYGTEADSPMSALHGKTAYQIVNVVNCLKTSSDPKECGISGAHNNAFHRLVR